MKGQHRTSAEKANTHDSLFPLLQAMFSEFKELSKRRPDSVVSKIKIAIVNRLLEKLRPILASEDAIAFLDLLNEDDIPQASDVTLVLSQYVAAMDAFHAKHYDRILHYWRIE